MGRGGRERVLLASSGAAELPTRQETVPTRNYPAQSGNSPRGEKLL